MVTLGKSFYISGFLYELVMNTEISTVTCFCCCFFRLTICIPFLIRKIATFYRTVFSKFVKMYNIYQYVLLEITNT